MELGGFSDIEGKAATGSGEERDTSQFQIRVCAAAVSFGSSIVALVILSGAKDLSKGERSHRSSLRARRYDCEVPHFVRNDTL
jgi:hypothetical protein